MSEKKLTKEELELVEYLKANFKTKSDLRENRKFYVGLMRHHRNIIIDCFGEHNKIKYTFEMIIENAKLSESYSDWIKKSPQMYDRSIRNQWLSEVKKIWPEPIKSKKKIKKSYSLEVCKKIGLKYQSQNQWINSKESKIFYFAKKSNWLEICCKHMKTYTNWDNESVQKEANKFKTKSEWQYNSPNSYLWAKKRKLLNTFGNHMVSARKHKKIMCIETSVVFKSTYECGKIMNLNTKKIYDVLRKKQKSTGGYTFKYVEDSND